VAAPIAQHILEQCISMDQGNLEVKVEKLTPAHSDHSFNIIQALPPYGKSGIDPKITPEVEANTNRDTDASSQMDRGNAQPNIRQGTDAGGRVSGQKNQPPPKPVEKQNFWQKFFGGGSKNTAPNPAPPRPAGPPKR